MRQMSSTRRRLAAGAFLIVAGPVALGSVAYACQSLATLHANPASAAAGDTVTLFGKNYSSSASSTNIEIHMDARDGAVIGSFAPTAILNGTVTMPLGTSAGAHTLVATQSTAAGVAVSGTPGRATVTVTVAGRTSADGASTAPAASASTDAGAATPTAATPASPAAAAAAPSAATSASGAAAQAVAAPSAPAVSGGATAPAANVATAPAAQAGVASSAPAVSAPDAAAVPSASVAGPASVNVGLVPASSESTSILPGLTLVAGLSLVLLGLVAFLKSGRTILGGGPLAG